MPINREEPSDQGRASADATGEMGDDDLETVVGGASPPGTKTPAPFGYSPPTTTDEDDLPLPSIG